MIFTHQGGSVLGVSVHQHCCTTSWRAARYNVGHLEQTPAQKEQQNKVAECCRNAQSITYTCSNMSPAKLMNGLVFDHLYHVFSSFSKYQLASVYTTSTRLLITQKQITYWITWTLLLK